MIIARGNTKDGRTEYLILGLVTENIDRLLKGHPIHIRRVTHGDGCPEGWEIMLMAAPTEELLLQDFKRSGFVDEATPMIPTRQLGRNDET